VVFRLAQLLYFQCVFLYVCVLCSFPCRHVCALRPGLRGPVPTRGADSAPQTTWVNLRGSRTRGREKKEETGREEGNVVTLC